MCLNGLVYVIGGFNGINRLRTVDILNLLTDKWEKGPDLVCVRSTHNVALLNNKVYAIGGFDGVSGRSLKFLSSNNNYLIFSRDHVCGSV